MTLIDKDALKKDVLDLSNCYNGFSDTYDKACIIGVIDEQPTIEERKWIPCSERLPEDDTVVLVCGKCGGVYTAIHNNSKTWIRGWWKMNSKNHYCNPIAWMPLPEPFKGVTE